MIELVSVQVSKTSPKTYFIRNGLLRGLASKELPRALMFYQTMDHTSLPNLPSTVIAQATDINQLQELYPELFI
jgi:hypothetical protein